MNPGHAIPHPGVVPAAFFDVDNTIVRGASAFHIAQGLRQRGFISNGDILKFGWQQLKFRMVGETKKQIDDVREDALSLLKGWSVAEMAAIGEEVYDEVMALRIFPETKALIDHHIAQSHEVWLITASPVDIGRLIARRLGATGALGTVLESVDGYYTGAIIGEMLHGEAKTVAVRKLADERGLDLSASFAYGDSINDRPMLQAVGNPSPINPDSKLRRYAKKQGWEIREFRGKRGGRRSIMRASFTGFVWVTMTVMRGIKALVLRPLRRRRNKRAA